MVLLPEVKDKLLFWQRQIEVFNGQSIWPSPSAVRVVYSDASNTGYGGYYLEHSCYVANGQWTGQETQQSCTWRELKAVRLVLESFVGKLRNQRRVGLLITKMWLGLCCMGAGNRFYRLKPWLYSLCV